MTVRAEAVEEEGAFEREAAVVLDVLAVLEGGEIGTHAANIKVVRINPVSTTRERAVSPKSLQGLHRTRLCTFASAYFFPVLPKPPSPRSLLSNSSTTWNPTCITGTMTSCARRSIGFSTKAVLPRFQVDTISCP